MLWKTLFSIWNKQIDHQPQIPPTPVNNLPPTPVNNIPLVVDAGIAEDAHDELNPLEEKLHEEHPLQEPQNNLLMASNFQKIKKDKKTE